jgi:Peptidase family M50
VDIFAAIGGTAWTVFFFIVALSIIVFVHEYGHYIVGRWSGIHAEVFSVGFGPVLWKRRDKRGTQWQVAAIPFGGYVKFLMQARCARRMYRACRRPSVGTRWQAPPCGRGRRRWRRGRWRISS